MKTLLSVYYDGLCPLCSREIEHYRKNPKSNRIRWVDITHPNFSAEQEGLEPKEVHRYLHAKDENGKILTGVDTFTAIWKALESYTLLIKIAQSPLGRPIFEASYKTFAKIRPYLPRRLRADCNNGHCSTERTSR